MNNSENYVMDISKTDMECFLQCLENMKIIIKWYKDVRHIDTPSLSPAPAPPPPPQKKTKQKLTTQIKQNVFYLIIGFFYVFFTIFQEALLTKHFYERIEIP